MEQIKTEQNIEERIEPKIRVSRDGKWVIIRVPGIEQPIIKAVAYFRAILDNAEKKSNGLAEEIKN